MRQSGSLPPGAQLWWRWLVTAADGTGYESPRQTILWLDDIHAWQVITGGNVNLHYYEGGDSFGAELHDYAADALARLARDVGLRPERAVDLYIYANTQDMQDAILYEPSWTGGQAFPAHNIVIIGISPVDLEWGRTTEAHEITHVLVGQLTFTCLGFVPTWLNEGLAMVGEGGLDAYQQPLFDQAVADDTLPSLRSLGGGFSEESTRANLSYSTSFSVVDFMIRSYGRQRMTSLLEGLRDGLPADEALTIVYGFDVDGLEDAWRADIGAAPRLAGAEATPVPTPTIVPTIVPVSGTPAAGSLPTAPGTAVPAAGPTALPTPAEATPLSPGPAFSLPSLSLEAKLILQFGLLCIVIAVILVGVPVLVTTSRRRRNK
jgi:hypothetical protein